MGYFVFWINLLRKFCVFLCIMLCKFLSIGVVNWLYIFGLEVRVIKLMCFFIGLVIDIVFVSSCWFFGVIVIVIRILL